MISVVIPAYNESGGIGSTVTAVRQTLIDAGIEGFEILVVNDGSSDGTAAEAVAAGAAVISHPHNLGYGHSLKRGILAARHPTIAITDADMTYPVDRIPALLDEYRKGFDMVVGQRTGQYYRESVVKAPLRRLLKFLVEYAAGRRIPDVNSGLRIFNRDVATNYFNHVCDTFSFTTSLTLAYMMNGRFVGYVPIPYHHRAGRSKVRLLRDSLRTLQYIIEAVIYFNPLKAFLLLAMILVAGSLLSFLVGTIFSLNALYYLGVGSVMLAVLTTCLGFLAVLLKQIMLQNSSRGSAQPAATAPDDAER